MVAEEVAYHVVMPNVPASVAEQVRKALARYPGVRIVSGSRRTYPAGTMAANVLGHVGPANRAAGNDEDDDLSQIFGGDASAGEAAKLAIPVGRQGIELACETVLRGQTGVQIHLTDQRGQRRGLDSCQPPKPGGDVRLSLDPAVQQAAEALLDRALTQATNRGRELINREERDSGDHDSGSRDDSPAASAAGGAIVVMNVANGELLAAASAPRFDPNVFTHGDDEALAAQLAATGHPLFDRVAKMALPPGSVFKIISAVALLESRAIEPGTPYFCQGYCATPIICAARSIAITVSDMAMFA